MGQINLKTRQQRIGYIENKEFFLTSSDQYSRIGAEQIIEYSCENSGIPKAQMVSAFYALSQQIEQFLLNGHGIELLNLGCLYLSVNAKAVESEKEAGAKAVKRISVKFRQSKKLRDLINSNVQLVNELTKKSTDTDDIEEDDGSTTPNTNTGSSTSDNTGENTGDNGNGGSTSDNGSGNTGGNNGGGGDPDDNGGFNNE